MDQYKNLLHYTCFGIVCEKNIIYNTMKQSEKLFSAMMVCHLADAEQMPFCLTDVWNRWC